MEFIAKTLQKINKKGTRNIGEYTTLECSKMKHHFCPVIRSSKHLNVYIFGL